MNLTIFLQLYAKIVTVNVWKLCINYKLTKVTGNTKTCMFNEKTSTAPTGSLIASLLGRWNEVLERFSHGKFPEKLCVYNSLYIAHHYPMKSQYDYTWHHCRGTSLHPEPIWWSFIHLNIKLATTQKPYHGILHQPATTFKGNIRR